MSESDSEYTESPIKAKNKRIRGEKSSASKKKKQDSGDESEDDYVDETGGVNAVITEKPSPPVSPTTATPSKRAKPEHHHRQTSFRGVTPGQAEDVYVDQDGTQMVEKKPQFHGLDDSENATSPFGSASHVNYIGYNINPADHGVKSLNYVYG
jgi:hypothetical protein